MDKDVKKIWFFENFNLFDCLSKEEKMRLSKLSRMREAQKNQIIFHPQDTSQTLYFLKKGQVKISSYSEKGKEITHALLGPGEMFGELALTGQGVRDMMAVATEDTLICVAHVKEFEIILQENPCLNLQITKLLGFKLKRLNMRLERLWFKSAPERVKALIQDLADDYGVKEGNKIKITLKLTHQDLANLAATSRQTVSTTFSELEKQGIISYSRRLLVINKPKEIEVD